MDGSSHLQLLLPCFSSIVNFSDAVLPRISIRSQPHHVPSLIAKEGFEIDVISSLEICSIFADSRPAHSLAFESDSRKSSCLCWGKRSITKLRGSPEVCLICAFCGLSGSDISYCITWSPNSNERLESIVFEVFCLEWPSKGNGIVVVVLDRKRIGLGGMRYVVLRNE